MTVPADPRSASGPGPDRGSLLRRLADWAFSPRTASHRPVRNWLLTRLGRAPERSELATDCTQCGQWDRVTVFRLGPRRARYWCRRCGAVVTVPDRVALRAVAELRDANPVPARRDAELREVMPASMIAWLAGRRVRPVTPERLDKPTIYQLYRDWDAHLQHLPEDRLEALAVDGEPPPPPGLPAFSAVAGAVQDACYRTELAATVLAERAPGATEAYRVGVWQRAEHARRWLAIRGQQWSWVHNRVPGSQLAEPDRAVVEAAAAALRSGAEPSETQARAARAALMGTEGGPRLATLARIYSPERLLAALESYLDTGARPLRDDVLARLSAPLALTPPAGR